MPRLAGQIDLAKSEAILEAAYQVLAERGLAAPIEEIARRAGVSKQTVYNHFGSKTELVRELVARRVSSMTAPLREQDAEAHPEEALAAYARTLIAVVTTRSYNLMRITMQSAAELPELAREVFENGPKASRAQLARFLEMEVKAGRLAIDDIAQAADFFAGMVVSHRQTEALLGLGRPPTDEEADRTAKAAARVFMKAYAP
jgi:AcrR family transcriptional regulator